MVSREHDVMVWKIHHDITFKVSVIKKIKVGELNRAGFGGG